MIMIVKFINWLPCIQWLIYYKKKWGKSTFGNSSIRLIDDVLQPTKSSQYLVKENNNEYFENQPITLKRIYIG